MFSDVIANSAKDKKEEMMEKQGGLRAVQQMQILKVMDSDSLYMHHI